MLERGEDPERARNWGYSIEQNEKWEDKLAATDVRRDKGDIGEWKKAEVARGGRRRASFRLVEAVGSQRQRKSGEELDSSPQLEPLVPRH
jgi:hypothetical protein